METKYILDLKWQELSLDEFDGGLWWLKYACWTCRKQNKVYIKNCILHNKQKDCFLMLVVMLSKLDLTSHHGTWAEASLGFIGCDWDPGEWRPLGQERGSQSQPMKPKLASAHVLAITTALVHQTLLSTNGNNSLQSKHRYQFRSRQKIIWLY